MKVAVIISAGGKGSRFKGKISKQFVSVEGKPMLTHVISRFEMCDMVDGIYVAVPEESIKFCIDNCIDPFKFQKLNKIVEGGKERSDSVFNCLEELDDDFDIVVIHDGVRIFVNKSMIEDSINIAKKHGAAICAIPLNDTIKLVSKDNYVKKTMDRKGIYCVQTPQTFKKDLLIQAYDKVGLLRSKFTDDSTIVEEYTSCTVKVVSGSIFNIKITSEEDFELARIYLRAGY